MFNIRKENTRFAVLCVVLFVVLAVKNTVSLMKVIRRVQNSAKVENSQGSVPRDIDPIDPPLLLRSGKQPVKFVLTPVSHPIIEAADQRPPRKGRPESVPAADAKNDHPQHVEAKFVVPEAIGVLPQQKSQQSNESVLPATADEPQHVEAKLVAEPKEAIVLPHVEAKLVAAVPEEAIVLPHVDAKLFVPPARKRDKLEFVHIPKTGGSAIEYVGSLSNVTWGVCHWLARPLAGPGCHKPDWKGFDARQKIGDKEIIWEQWHIPPRYVPEISPYQNKKLFAVVRNPYERFISEFYCPYTGWNKVDWSRANRDFDDPMGTTIDEARKWGNFKKQAGPQEKKNETPNKLNEFLMERLEKKVKWTAHYIPMAHYVYDEEGNQIVDHVLKHENLQEEFTDLMAEYDLPVYLNRTINQRSGAKEIRMTVRDLFPATIRRINHLFRDDFTKFGYEMIDPESLAEQLARERAVQRIYYINLQKNVERRKTMEGWLGKQPIPFERINATIGSSNPRDCVPGKWACPPT